MRRSLACSMESAPTLTTDSSRLSSRLSARPSASTPPRLSASTPPRLSAGGGSRWNATGLQRAEESSADVITSSTEGSAERTSGTDLTSGTEPSRGTVTTAHRQTSSEEPRMVEGSADSIEDWQRWALREAQLHAIHKHPRVPAPRRAGSGEVSPGGSPTSPGGGKTATMVSLDLQCSLDEMMIVLQSSGVRLYFDFLRFTAGFGLIGLLIAAPSVFASLSHVYDEAYDQQASRYDLGALPFPKWFSLFTLGARVDFLDSARNVKVLGCNTDVCKALNTAMALLDTLFCFLLYWGVTSFIGYARQTAAAQAALNVEIGDYTVRVEVVVRVEVGVRVAVRVRVRMWRSGTIR